MTYHLCAEDLTKSTIVPNLPEEERKALMEHGILPLESSAKDRFCVMCPVKRGSPRLLPGGLCYNWRHIGCSYQTHLGRVCPCHVQILDPKSYVVLPARNTTRPDTESIETEVEYRAYRDDTSLSRWSPASWLMPKLVNVRDYSFPKSLVVPYTWMCAPRALSLSDAVNCV